MSANIETYMHDLGRRARAAARVLARTGPREEFDAAMEHVTKMEPHMAKEIVFRAETRR